MKEKSNGTPVVPIVSSSLLSRFQELTFGISTRQGGVSTHPLDLNLSFSVGDLEENVNVNRQRFFSTLNIPLQRLAIPRQIHSDTVRLVTKPGLYPETDALITSTLGLFLVVTLADCLPIFLYDRARSVIAAVHAGWRGTHSKIVLKALELMQGEFGTDPKEVFAFIGQGAGVCCYEVGREVSDLFDRKYISTVSGKQLHLDIKLANRDLLLHAGIPDDRVEVSSECTICRPELFHSYRREGHQSGRMMGVIGIRG